MASRAQLGPNTLSLFDAGPGLMTPTVEFMKVTTAGEGASRFVAGYRIVGKANVQNRNGAPSKRPMCAVGLGRCASYHRERLSIVIHKQIETAQHQDDAKHPRYRHFLA